MIHRLRAEQALGKPLPPKAIVHHVDGTKSVNSPLVICQDHEYHMLLHRRMRIKALGGDPNTTWFCRVCRSLKPFAEFRLYNRRTGWLRTECLACTKLLKTDQGYRLPNQPHPGVPA